MSLEYAAMKERVRNRYPFFRSTFFERRMLFDVAAMAGSRHSTELPMLMPSARSDSLAAN